MMLLKCVAEHSSRLQLSIICMFQLQLLCSAALVRNVLPKKDEGSGKPCAVIEALQYNIGLYSGIEPGRFYSKS